MHGSVFNKPETLLVMKSKADERPVIAEKIIRLLLIQAKAGIDFYNNLKRDVGEAHMMKTEELV